MVAVGVESVVIAVGFSEGLWVYYELAQVSARERAVGFDLRLCHGRDGCEV